MNYTLVSIGLEIPVLCWALAARTLRVGICVGIVLIAIAVLEFAVIHRWVLSGLPFTLTFALSAATAVVLFWGLTAEERVAKAPRSTLHTIGRWGVVLCSTTAIPTLLLLLILVGATRRPELTPGDDAVLPLGSGLTVVTDIAAGCGGNTDSCERRVDVAPSGGGRPGIATLAQVVLDLELRHRWHLTYPSAVQGWWQCHTTGFFLDWEYECVNVSEQDGDAVVISVRHPDMIY